MTNVAILGVLTLAGAAALAFGKTPRKSSPPPVIGSPPGGEGPTGEADPPIVAGQADAAQVGGGAGQLAPGDNPHALDGVQPFQATETPPLPAAQQTPGGGQLAPTPPKPKGKALYAYVPNWAATPSQLDQDAAGARAAAGGQVVLL